MFVTGHDVVRVARMLAVPPWHFVTALPAPAGADDAFALDASEKRFRLALLRRRFAENERPSCTFVTRLPEEIVRCGLGEGRPLPCLSFPLVASAEPASPDVRADLSGCTCDWGGAALDDVEGTSHLAELANARVRYRTVLDRWSRVVAAGAETIFEVRDFLRFLMDDDA